MIYTYNYSLENLMLTWKSELKAYMTIYWYTRKCRKINFCFTIVLIFYIYLYIVKFIFIWYIHIITIISGERKFELVSSLCKSSAQNITNFIKQKIKNINKIKTNGILCLLSLFVDKCILGCICFGWKWFKETILHSLVCLVNTENSVKRKSISALTIK